MRIGWGEEGAGVRLDSEGRGEDDIEYVRVSSFNVFHFLRFRRYLTLFFCMVVLGGLGTCTVFFHAFSFVCIYTVHIFLPFVASCRYYQRLLMTPSIPRYLVLFHSIPQLVVDFVCD